MPIRLRDHDGRPAASSASWIGTGDINARVHGPGSGETMFVVVVRIVHLEPPRTQAPLRISRPWDAKDLVVLIPLPFQDGNMFGVGQTLRSFQGILSHAIASLDGIREGDGHRPSPRLLGRQLLIYGVGHLVVAATRLRNDSGLKLFLVRHRRRVALLALGHGRGPGRDLVHVLQQDAVVGDSLRPAILWHNHDVAPIDALYRDGPLHICTGLGLGLGKGRAARADVANPAPEALLEPVEPEEDDAGVEGDGVGEHGKQVDHGLLESIELVDVDGVQAGLRVGTAGKHQGINVGQASPAGGVDGNRGNDGCADDPKVCGNARQQCPWQTARLDIQWTEMKLKCGFLEKKAGLIALNCAQT